MNTPTCPICRCHEFELTVSQQIKVAFCDEPDEYDHEVYDGPDGDMEWTDDSPASCVDCGYSAPLGKMKASS